MVAMGINNEGHKEILAIEPMENESKDTWALFFNKLKNRGMQKVGLVVSDAHAGIQAALKSAFIGSAWQRCKVHFMRNILAKIPHKHKALIGKQLSHIFNQENYDQAKQIAMEVIQKFNTKFPDAIETLSDGLEDALQFFHFDELPYGRTSSTNHLERLNLEIRRRSNVVGISPSTDSFLWLIGSYLLEYQADWATSKAYIRPDKLDLFYVNNLERKVA